MFINQAIASDAEEESSFTTNLTKTKVPEEEETRRLST